MSICIPTVIPTDRSFPLSRLTGIWRQQRCSIRTSCIPKELQTRRLWIIIGKNSYRIRGIFEDWESQRWKKYIPVSLVIRVLQASVSTTNFLDSTVKLCYSISVIIDRRGHTGICSGQASVNGDIFYILEHIPFSFVKILHDCADNSMRGFYFSVFIPIQTIESVSMQGCSLVTCMHDSLNAHQDAVAQDFSYIRMTSEIILHPQKQKIESCMCKKISGNRPLSESNSPRTF